MYSISLLWCPWAWQFGHIRLGTLWQLPCLGMLSKGWPPLRFILVFKANWLRNKILSAYWWTRAAQGLLYRLPVNVMHLIVLLTTSSRVLEYHTKTVISDLRPLFRECVVLWNKSPRRGDPPSETPIPAYSSTEWRRVFLMYVFWKMIWYAILECPIPSRYCAVAMI